MITVTTAEAMDSFLGVGWLIKQRLQKAYPEVKFELPTLSGEYIAATPGRVVWWFDNLNKTYHADWRAS